MFFFSLYVIKFIMSILNKLINYIKDENFKITYINNSVNVVNYDKILEVKDDLITLEKENKLLFIKGENLKLNKLLDKEILITGLILEISL